MGYMIFSFSDPLILFALIYIVGPGKIDTLLFLTFALACKYYSYSGYWAIRIFSLLFGYIGWMGLYGNLIWFISGNLGTFYDTHFAQGQFHKYILQGFLFLEVLLNHDFPSTMSCSLIDE